MDTRYQKKTAGALGTMLLMLGCGGALASDAEMPNPFDPKPVMKESLGERLRHPFHDIRTKWDKYFEVYEKDLDGYEPQDLDRVRSTPIAFMDRKIRFDAYMGQLGEFYRPVMTPFTQGTHINFGLWPYGAELWTKDGRGTVLVTAYVDRVRTKLCDKVSSTPKFTPVRVWAKICAKADGLAWIEVHAMEPIPEAALTAQGLAAIELGASQLAAKRFELAETALEQGLAQSLPVVAEQKVYGLLGRARAEQRDYAGARNALVHSLLREPGNVRNLVLLAQTDLKLNKAAEAKQAAENAIKIDPANALAYAELGLARAWLDDIKGAYEALAHSQVLGRNQLPETYRNRAMVALRENKLTVARDELSQAVILRPSDIDLKMELGDVFLSLNDLDKAKSEFTQAKQLTKTRPEPYYKLALVQKKIGDNLAAENKADDAKKNYTEALEAVREAIRIDEKFGQAYVLRGELLKALGLPEETLPAGVQLSLQSLPPIESDAYALQYQAAEAAGDWAAMERLTRQAIAGTQSAMYYSRLGMILATKPNADLDGAIAAYDEALRRSPDRSHDWAAIGSLKLRYKKDVASAISALNRSLQLDPENGHAWTDLAVAQRHEGDSNAAVTSADNAIKNGGLIEATLVAAAARLDRGSPEDINAAYELAKNAQTAAASANDRAAAQSLTGAALLRQGKNAEALELLAQADPMMRDHSPEHLLAYGKALQGKGDTAAATEKLNAAIALTKDIPVTSRIAQNVVAAAETALHGEAKPNAAIPVSTRPVETPKGAPVIEDSSADEPVLIKAPGVR